VNIGSHRSKSQASRTKSTYLPFRLKTKSAAGKKWNVHAYVRRVRRLNIVFPDGTKLEKVVSPNDKLCPSRLPIAASTTAHRPAVDTRQLLDRSDGESYRSQT